MRMEQLRCLVDVAQTKSMSKTAERLFVSPQAVSKSIKQLEQELGAELLVRTSSGVAPTKLGLSIVELAEKMLADEQLMNRLIAENKQRMSKDAPHIMRICSNSVVTNIVLPTVLAKIKRQNINVVPRLTMVNSLEELLQQVENGDCDIGLLTYNEQELMRKFTKYQVVLQMDLLARDEIVVAMDRRLYREGQEYVSHEEHQQQIRTLYGMLPTESMEKLSNEAHMVCSNDADFHRMMMKKADAYVTMPGLAYHCFFNSKSCMALPVEDGDVPLLHAAVYRKDAADSLNRMVGMIRVEMQMQ